jgi:hypothetical protein
MTRFLKYLRNLMLQPKAIPRGGMDDLERIVAMIERAVSSKETRLIGRALRHNGPLRQKVTKDVLVKAVEKYIPDGSTRTALLQQVSGLPEVEGAGSVAMEEDGEREENPPAVVEPRSNVIPEVRRLSSAVFVPTCPLA